MRLGQWMGGLVMLASLSAPQSGAGVVSVPDVLLQVPPFEGAWTSDLSSPPSDPIGQFADTFELAEPSLVSSVTFWGFYSGSGDLPVDDFSLRFFDVAGGVPVAAPREEEFLMTLSRTVFRPGEPAFVATYEYAATLAPVTLPAGTYGVSIVNNLSGDPRVWSVVLNQDLSGQGFNRNEDGVPWAPVLGELAIELRGSVVPEPNSLFLLGSFLLVALHRRCR